ncbi:7-methylguanosine phosphate-specific 5'-nucleotidase A-like isoform X1 [Poecilia formosa]|uniref:7-methylguanosine phosphate-specific 5'-nucleotidase A-like isoform X1 n=1 Tax=Poecilia formosa TaxID=48698 RepID=UPI000443FC3C|nr:PREDICTED: 7-methylguanosine phosphate-specific 5'-nucleotidase A-like isoform X1 [Poecilia formosa]
MQVFHIPWIYTPVRTILAIWHQLTKTEIPELTRVSVMMRERSRVEDTMYAMQKAGAGSLQVISDFDMTLTKFAHKGKRVPTTHNILNNRLLIDDDSTVKMKKLFNTYYPIEIDASLNPEEKLPYMVEWWTKVHDLLIQQRIRKDELARAVRDSNAVLREGCSAFFDCLAEQRVPLLIFSAGVGDILEEVIRQNHVFHPNVHIISNYMDFDHTGVLQAFKGQLIHSYNKRAGALSHGATLRELHGQPNVLLLGDSLGDLSMADGVSTAQNILTVGFLNDQVEERKESFLNSFDIVLLRDETMDVPNAILRFIVSSEISKVHREK